MPLPPVDEQRELVKCLDVAFNQIDKLRAQALSSDAKLDQLDSSILAKAFRGELVPQDPSDEPASVLLEKIRAEREAAAPKKTKQASKKNKARRKSK